MYGNTRFVGWVIRLNVINGSMVKTSLREFCKTFGLEEDSKILSRDVIPTMGDQVDTKETKHPP